jgi:hypothetical protein
MYRAINEGMRLLDSPWVTYLNSDDFAYGDGYARLVARGEATSADVVYGNGDFVDAQGRFLYSLQAPHISTLPSLFRAGFFGFLPHAAVVRRAIFQELSGFDESFRLIADMDFFARACIAKKTFASVPYPSVAVFRVHPGQLSRKERDVVSGELRRLRPDFGTRGGLKGRMAVAKWRFRNTRQYVLRWLRTGSIRQASP